MSTYADRVGEEYERLQDRLVVRRGYFTGVREGQLVAQKHKHLAKLVRYYNCAQLWVVNQIEEEATICDVGMKRRALRPSFLLVADHSHDLIQVRPTRIVTVVVIHYLTLAIGIPFNTYYSTGNDRTIAETSTHLNHTTSLELFNIYDHNTSSC